jgi:hypothetical protein
MRKKAVIVALVGALGIISAFAVYEKVNFADANDAQNEQVDIYLDVSQGESTDSSSDVLSSEGEEGYPISYYTYTK